MTYSTATACFWLKPMSDKPVVHVAAVGVHGALSMGNAADEAKQVSKMGRPSTRKGTAKEMMA